MGPLAQLVEQGTFNPKVLGSSPRRPIRCFRRTCGSSWPRGSAFLRLHLPGVNTGVNSLEGGGTNPLPDLPSKRVPSMFTGPRAGRFNAGLWYFNALEEALAMAADIRVGAGPVALRR